MLLSHTEDVSSRVAAEAQEHREIYKAHVFCSMLGTA